MTTQEKTLELVERYVQNTGQHLPKKLREDVKAELRSLLMETMEERSKATGRALDEALAVEVLREFGKPEAVAERYQPPPGYLIGPRLYPAFVLVAQIIVAALIGIHALILVLTLARSGWRFPEELSPTNLFDWISAVARSVFLNLGLLALVFAVIERLWKPGAPQEDRDAPWNPEELPKVEDPDRVSPGGIVARVYVVGLFLVMFNFFPQWVGIIYFNDNEARSIPLSSLGVHLPMIWLNLWWAMALGLNAWLLKLGRWTPVTRWAQLLLGGAGIAILVLIVSRSGGGAEVRADLSDVANNGVVAVGKLVRFVLGISLVIAVVENAVRLYRLMTRYA